MEVCRRKNAPETSPTTTSCNAPFEAFFCSSKGLPDFFGYDAAIDFFKTGNPIRGMPFVALPVDNGDSDTKRKNETV